MSYTEKNEEDRQFEYTQENEHGIVARPINNGSFDVDFHTETQSVIEQAKSLIGKLKEQRLVACPEDQKFSKLHEKSEKEDDTNYSAERDPHLPTESPNSRLTIQEKELDGQEVILGLESLIHMLSKSNEQAKQLKFKNLMLTAGLKDSTSRFEVESNLTKQQFERIRCQLAMETQELHEKVRVQDFKISKYKETIIEKNKEINKLTRLLNDLSAPSPFHRKNTPQSVTKRTRLGKEAKLQRKDSNMLATLGLLASHVLGDGNETQGSIDNTESDISHDSFSKQAKASKGLSMPVLPKISSASLTPTSDSSSNNPFQMPKLASEF